MPYDPQKHHRRSIRLKGYDYTQPGAYFVTICTQGHICMFGDVVDDNMVLNDVGRMVQTVWETMPERFPTIELGTYVIMPNHFHAIITINDEAEAVPDTIATVEGDHQGRPHDTGTAVRAGTNPVPTMTTTVEGDHQGRPHDAGTAVRAGTNPVPTMTATVEGDHKGRPYDAGTADIKHPALGTIIGTFKSITTHEYIMGVRNKGWPPFNKRLWQRNYWEHIIRNETEYWRIYQYIEDNPARWENDQLHPAQVEHESPLVQAVREPPVRDSPRNESATIVQRLWNYCNVLRDDGVSYGDYVEQLTYLLFLKMADEQEREFDKKSVIPPEYSWASLRGLSGDELEQHYRVILAELGKGSGLIPVIFRKAQNRIQDPAKLRRLINLIDGETWTGLGIDVKGDIYEGLLEKNAQDVKSGAGQYFTPRPLIQAMVDVMAPRPGQIICDPACGTGGFLIAAHDYIAARHGPLNRDQWQHLNHESLHGWEIVDNTARLCVMNLYLRGIGANGGRSPIHVGDSLAADPGERFDMVLTNPPFGKKSSVTYVTEEGELHRESQTIVRDDFWTSTSNKQLNFVQHVKTILKINGRAAIVVPDNVLFEGGAGETVRRKLLHECAIHTLLRLPTGIFYAQGVKANVLFFDRKPASATPWTKTLWIYDLRTNKHFTLKQNPLTRADLDEFVACYNPANRHERAPTWSDETPEGRWRAFSYEELLARDKINLDIFWLRDKSLEETANLPDPDVLAAEIVDDLEAALEQFRAIAEDLGK